VVLRIQPHFHPMPKGDGLSRSERAVNNVLLSLFYLLPFSTHKISFVSIFFPNIAAHTTIM
ncbi:MULTISPECIES: hypothetical protein, partial [unclassified Bacillus cereus group]|uniref:hypothetical protein n=1 Tax=unclassified Bacillus cereus group TaxID=2750818 RepID=UPI0022E1CB8B